jgi:hypothetical protein
MSSKTRFSLVLAVVMLPPWILATQDTPSIPVDEIVRKFAENEKAARSAWEKHSYRLELTAQELDSRNRVLGEGRYVSDVAPVQAGNRSETKLPSVPPTLKRINLTSEDMKDFREIVPFSLTTEAIQEYDTTYVGTETINEGNCFVFEVKPKKTEKGQRYFQGRIWVENQTFHIVKTIGKSAPDIRQNGRENLFPAYATTRERIGGHWFPTVAEADQDLSFSNLSVRVRVSVRYSNYSKP